MELGERHLLLVRHVDATSPHASCTLQLFGLGSLLLKGETRRKVAKVVLEVYIELPGEKLLRLGCFVVEHGRLLRTDMRVLCVFLVVLE